MAALSEHAQATRAAMPEYSFTAAGAAHAPTFSCTCNYAGQSSTGAGKTKREARASAAAALVTAIRDA